MSTTFNRSQKLKAVLVIVARSRLPCQMRNLRTPPICPHISGEFWVSENQDRWLTRLRQFRGTRVDREARVGTCGMSTGRVHACTINLANKLGRARWSVERIFGQPVLASGS